MIYKETLQIESYGEWNRPPAYTVKAVVMVLMLLAVISAPVYGQKKRRKPVKPEPEVPAIPTTTPVPPPQIPTEIEKANATVSKVIDRAEVHFKQGEANLKDNRREQARDEFDKAVDTILNSGMDVRANQRLQTYYLELVERIYRLEVPQQRTNPGSTFSQQIAQNVPVTINNSQSEIVGFKDQEFEPSPIDELAKLILSTDTGKVAEINTTPVLQGGERIRLLREKLQQLKEMRAQLLTTYTEEWPAVKRIGEQIKNLEEILAQASKEAECSSNSKQSFELRGFRLGMTLGEIGKRVPQLRVSTADRFGYASVTIRPSGKAGSGSLKGVMGAALDFLDGRLFNIVMVYDNSTTWNSADQFISRVGEALQLPDNWRAFPDIHPYRGETLKTAYCGAYQFIAGFVVFDDYQKRPVIYWYDNSARALLNKRRTEAIDIERKKRLDEEEKKRKTFKP